MSWVRLYVEILDDPKTAMLPDGQFRLFCEALCLARIANMGGDTGLTVEQLDWRLRKKTAKAVSSLCGIGVLQMTPAGTVSVTQWVKRQFESDTSTERVKKFREKHKPTVNETVNETPGETFPERSATVTETAPDSDTDTDSDTEQNHKKKRARRAPCVSLPPDFGISERVREWAQEKGHTRLDEHLDYFLSYARRKAATYADWDEALMFAIRKNWAELAVTPDADQDDSDEAMAARAMVLFEAENERRAAMRASQ